MFTIPKKFLKATALCFAVALSSTYAPNYLYSQCDDEPVAQGFFVDVENNDCPYQGGICAMVAADCPFDMD